MGPADGRRARARRARSPAGSFVGASNYCWGYCNYKYVNTTLSPSCSSACAPSAPCGTTSGTCQAYGCVDANNKPATSGAMTAGACPLTSLNKAWRYNGFCGVTYTACPSPPPPPSPSPPPPSSPPPPPPSPPPGVKSCMTLTSGMATVLNLPLGTTPAAVTATCTTYLLSGQFITAGASVPGSTCSGDMFVAIMFNGAVVAKSGGYGCNSISWTALQTGTYTIAAGCAGTNIACNAVVAYQISPGSWANEMTPLKVAGTNGVYYGQCAVTNGKDNTGSVAGAAVWKDSTMPLNAGAYWQNPGIATGNGVVTPIATASDTNSGVAYCIGQPGTYRVGGAVGTNGQQLACYNYAGAVCVPGSAGCPCDYQKQANGAVSVPTTTQQVVNGGLVPIPSQQSWNCLACPPINTPIAG